MTLGDATPFILALVGITELLIGWVVRDTMKRIDTLMLQGTSHETRLAVLADSKVHDRVSDHEARLRALEAGLGEIRSDVKIIREILENRTPRPRTPKG